MIRRLQPLGDSWYAWSEDLRGDAAIRVRVVDSPDGRFRVSGLEVEGAISADVLRSIPIGRIEASANAELHHTAGASRARRPRARIAPSLRSNAVQGYPDSFYAAVASTYRHLSGTSPRPVGDIADANDVPVTTAQRWVKEARRRGLLAPGHPGKAG